MAHLDIAYTQGRIWREGDPVWYGDTPARHEAIPVRLRGPDENIEGGVKYLRYLLDRYEGNLSLTLAAYNSGETAVKKWGTIPPFKETQDYVKKVLRIYNGTGNTFAPRYTIYIGAGADGSILLTDNPVNHPDKKLRRKTGQSL